MSAGMRPWGEAAVVDAVEVVVVDVVGEVAFEACEAEVEVAGESGPPALFEDQSMERFDGAFGLGAAGANQGVLEAEVAERVSEVACAELAAVVCEDALEAPSGFPSDWRPHSATRAPGPCNRAEGRLR